MATPHPSHAPAAMPRRIGSRGVVSGSAKPWKSWITLVVVAAALMILATRVWVKNKNAHMVYAGQVTADFSLYHGWGNRFLVTFSDPQSAGAAAVLIDPAASPPAAYFCHRADYFDLKLFAFDKTLASGCTRSPAQDVQLSPTSLEFRSAIGAQVEITWERPW